jgi:hypothetical protein
VFLGTEKHATVFNFIFHGGQGCEAALAKGARRFAKPAAKKVWVERKSKPRDDGLYCAKRSGATG